MQFVNYPAYIEWGFIGISVQGRYLFPVILPIYGLTAGFMISYWPERLQLGVVLLVAVVFLVGDFPFFLTHDELGTVLWRDLRTTHPQNFEQLF